MADLICTIEGCGGKYLARGFCNKHYRRWRRNGDPLKANRFYGEATRFLQEVALPYASDECLLWPFSKRPYSLVNIGNYERVAAHRLICEAVHGKPPSDKHGALHTCNNARCVNSRHLYWGTQKDNVADAIKAGTFIPPGVRAKLCRFSGP